MIAPDLWTSLSLEAALLYQQTSLLRLVGFFLVLGFASWVGHAVRSGLRWLWALNLDRQRRLAPLATLMQLGIGIFAFARLLAHGFRVAPGVSLLVLLVAAPTTGLVLRLPLQNIFAGITLLVQRTLREGDDIRLGDTRSARIEQIRLTSTLAVTDTGAELIVPNALLLTSLVQKLPRQSGVGLLVVIPGSRPPLPEEIELARTILVFSPFRVPGSPVEARAERNGRGIELSIRVLSEASKRAASRELSQKVSQAVDLSAVAGQSSPSAPS